jgi:hypothetical protein
MLSKDRRFVLPADARRAPAAAVPHSYKLQTNNCLCYVCCCLCMQSAAAAEAGGYGCQLMRELQIMMAAGRHSCID